MATPALPSSGATSFAAGSSSSTMPSSLATTGWACSMTSLAAALMRSTSPRALRTVSAISTTAHAARTIRTRTAMSM